MRRAHQHRGLRVLPTVPPAAAATAAAAAVLALRGQHFEKRLLPFFVVVLSSPRLTGRNLAACLERFHRRQGRGSARVLVLGGDGREHADDVRDLAGLVARHRVALEVVAEQLPLWAYRNRIVGWVDVV